MPLEHYTEIISLVSDVREKIVRLEGKVDGINQRLDVTNGRVEKGERRDDELKKKIDSLELTRAENKGSRTATAAFIMAISTAVYFILGKVFR